MPFASYQKFVRIDAPFSKFGPKLQPKMQERALDGRQTF
jgi:hypothetical protein